MRKLAIVGVIVVVGLIFAYKWLNPEATPPVKVEPSPTVAPSPAPSETWLKPEPTPPARPTSTHDPVHAGYPDTPEKPELVKQAEQLIVKNWDYAQEVWPQFASDEAFASICKDHEAHKLRFRSDAEKEEYRKCDVAVGVLAAVANYAQAKGQISNAKELRKAYWEYLFEEYLKKKRGIRLYRLGNREDREILGVGGGAVNPK
jgi:hypothetical protein